MTAFVADIGVATDKLAVWLLQAIVYGTLLALLTGAGLRLVRRVPPVMHAALWLIVLLKFLIPLGPSWTWSLASVMGQATGWLQADPSQQPGEPAAGPRVIWLAQDAAGNAAAPPASQPQAGWSLAAVLCGLYLVGLTAVFGVRITAYRRFTRACRDLPEADPSVAQLVGEVCRRLNVRRVPITRLSEDAPAPFVYGLWRPCLVLSRIHLVRPDELEAVVLHEIAHLRRGDLLIRYVQWFAGTVLFFWPVVAWVNRRLDLAREHACDEWALRHGRLSAGQYARCLLLAVHPAPPRRWVYHPAAMAARKGTIERRIDMILDNCASRRRPGMWGLIGGSLLATWAVFALSGASLAEPPADEKAAATPAPRVVILRAGEGEWQEADSADVAIRHHKMMKQLHVEAMQADGEVRVRLNGGDLIGEKMQMFFGGQDLAAFAEKYPQADLDADGTVSSVERGAYVVAVAMSDPAAVLAQFPAADKDGNRQLSDSEAARLLTTGVPHFVGHDGEMAATGIVIAKDSNSAAPTFNIKSLDSQDPAGWVLENIGGTPSARQAQAYVAVVEQTPLRVFFEMHPEADTDGDGAVSTDERDAFLENLVQQHLGELGIDKDGSKVFILGGIAPGEDAEAIEDAEFEIFIGEEVHEDGKQLLIEKKVRIEQIETEPDEM